MAQPPKRPTTRRPRAETGTTPRRTSTRKTAPTPEAATAAPTAADAPLAKPKRGRPPKAAASPAPTPAPAAAKSTAPTRTPKAPARRTRSAAKPTPAVAKQRHDQAGHQARDSHGRFKVGHRARTVALGVTGVVAAGLGIGAAFARGWLKLPKGKADKPVPHADASVTTLEEDALRPLDKD